MVGSHSQNTDSQKVGSTTGVTPGNSTQDELLELLLGMLRKEAMSKVAEVRSLPFLHVCDARTTQRGLIDLCV